MNFSTSGLKAAPPRMTSSKRPPKASMRLSRILLRMTWSTMGMRIRDLWRSTTGLICDLYTFSKMRGTAMMMSGWISEKAFMMTLGLGVRVRKYTWAPMVISKRNSNIMPYMCAEGSIATTCDSQVICGSAVSRAKRRLQFSARYGSMTPLEKPEVPEV